MEEAAADSLAGTAVALARIAWDLLVQVGRRTLAQERAGRVSAARA